MAPTNLLAGLLMLFCGEHQASTSNGTFSGRCVEVEYIASSSTNLLTPCVQQALVCILDLSLLLMVAVVSVICKHQNLSQKKGQLQESEPPCPKFYLFVILLSILVSLTNWGVGLWMLCSTVINQELIIFHDWIFHMVQGLSWIVTAVMLKPSLEGKKTNVAKVWLIVMFLLGTFMASMSVLDLFQGKCFSLHRGLVLTSWPICCCLVACALKQGNLTYTASSDSTEPLLSGSTKSTKSTKSIGDASITLEKTAGFFSHATFSWMNSLLYLGYSRPLERTDIPFISLEDQSDTNYQVFSESWESQKKKFPSKRPSAYYTLAQCYWKDLVYTGVYAFFRTASITAGPLLLRFFVDFSAGNIRFKHEGYVLVAALFIVKTIESFSQRHWYFGARRLGMKVRSALIAAVYEKELRLSSLGKRKHAAGEIVNYIGIDSYRIGDFPWWVHWVWIIPFQISIALVIFFTTVGLATIPGLILILLLILVNSPLAKLLQTCQNQLMKTQDERLRATTEVLNGMKVIKLQAWEDKFKALIDQLRKREVHWLGIAQRTRSYGTIIYWISPIVVGSVIFFTCIYLKVPLTATTIFTVLATFRIIQEPVRMVPDLLATIIQVRVSLHRLDEFLQGDELQKDAVDWHGCKQAEYAIRIDSGVLSWNSDSEEKPTLKGINLLVRDGEKIAVCGSIGSGKSTLLHSILGEIPRISGTVRLSGRIAYVAQSAWIQTGTIKDNILFGMPMDEIRYKKALQACALEQDISNFPHGDLTEIGERGMNMSGGQKQRIQLARAVYNDADIYLLDDPFSAVDAHTATTLFNDCVLGALRSKAVVLVTHQVEFLPAVDYILVMQEGEIKQAGTYDQLVTAGDTFEKLVNAHQEALMSVNYDTETKEDDFELRIQRRLSALHACESMGEISVNTSQLIQDEERETGDTGIKPYYEYVHISGGASILAGMIFGQAAFVVANVSSSVWLAQQISNPRVSGLLLIGVYTVLSVISGVFVFMRSRLSANLGLKASKAFFDGMTSSVIKAPMAFFDSTPTGRILSRASADMSILDLDIPFCFGFVMAGSFDLTGILVVIALVTWKILLVAIPMLFVVRKLQAFYLASSRELMRMNSTSKAPIVNNSSETMSGAVTIRAFQMVARFRRKNMQLVDHDASLFFHIQAAAEWLSMRLEAIGNVVLCVAALLLVSLPADQMSPGFVGLAISYALALNSCQVFLVWWQCCLANYIISVERIQQYMNLPREAPEFIESKRPSPEWPSKGQVILENLKIRYRPNSPLVLRGITCTFEGGHKVGVVGRTGSGKTTLIGALFRLVEPAGGRILIDDIDICSIGLHDLRLRLGIIPQEPILFRGTVRSNLDPLNQYSDFLIWETLDKCQLGNVIRKLPKQLDSTVSDEGENWSGGQRQLFCLGRVLLKRSKILVLDEATASIDSTTDALLQIVIRKEFSECTVITVAHRIPTVINSDMVLALRDGFLSEFDTPKKLMERRTSLFAKLVSDYWAQSSHGSRQNLSKYIEVPVSSFPQ